ncbi:flagellar hook-length control protein FliK [Neogemmobacter tilapiae]|uniref:Flagellar hook-length control protein n=1 Tax=Neogemmobacter tilapiae TaxID=875041 RepID=A0A918TMR5_9RHOB|nr:flagellar hook-length control protein FliK [Gemmobacter tilapiae]GHC51895.1 flagellar hook-length control protein [Gemmobacter tilapiae]
MQVTAILGLAMPVATEQMQGMPLAGGEWSNLLAAFAATEEDALPDASVTLPDLAVSFVAPSAPTVAGPAPVPQAASNPQVQGTGPVAEVAAADSAKAALSALPSAVAASPPPEGASDVPADPAEKPVVIVQAAPKALLGPKRSMAENMWEMQGLIPKPPIQETLDETHEMPPALPVSRVVRTVTRGSTPSESRPIAAQGANIETVHNPDEIPRLLSTESALEPHFIGTSPSAPLPLMHSPAPNAAQPLAQTLSPSFIAQVQAQAAAPVPGGINITLDPVELGELQMVMLQEGESLHIAITAERPETLELLRRHGDQLAQELRQAGFQSTSFSFSQSGQDARTTTPARTDDSPPPPSPTESTDPAPPRSTAAEQGGLDLRI